jgi:hypothetical protein
MAWRYSVNQGPHVVLVVQKRQLDTKNRLDAPLGRMTTSSNSANGLGTWLGNCGADGKAVDTLAD